MALGGLSAEPAGEHTKDETWRIKEVWADNLEAEFQAIESIVDVYRYIALDTEFPGVVVKADPNHKEYSYQTVKMNVDRMKVIQIGVTFADEFGRLPPGVSTWQFNFQFDLGADLHAENSIQFLKECGVDFETQQRRGISVAAFGEHIMNSGLVMKEDVKWISFHGTYDFGYLLKLLTCQALPEAESDFFEILHMYFPTLYDIKYLVQEAQVKAGGQSLQKLADYLEVRRVGQCHQAGSDSLVTCRTFFRLMQICFDNQLDDSKYSGIIYGLGVADQPASRYDYATTPTPSSIKASTVSGVSLSTNAAFPKRKTNQPQYSNISAYINNQLPLISANSNQTMTAPATVSLQETVSSLAVTEVSLLNSKPFQAYPCGGIGSSSNSSSSSSTGSTVSMQPSNFQYPSNHPNQLNNVLSSMTQNQVPHIYPDSRESFTYRNATYRGITATDGRTNSPAENSTIDIMSVSQDNVAITNSSQKPKGSLRGGHALFPNMTTCDEPFERHKSSKVSSDKVLPLNIDLRDPSANSTRTGLSGATVPSDNSLRSVDLTMVSPEFPRQPVESASDPLTFISTFAMTTLKKSNYGINCRDEMYINQHAPLQQLRLGSLTAKDTRPNGSNVSSSQCSPKDSVGVSGSVPPDYINAATAATAGGGM
eukprot:Filipodium_phascolosomae@DN2699_c0_g1_i5.p1